MTTLHHRPSDLESLPLWRWAVERERRHRAPTTAAGRWLAGRGVPRQRADLLAELAGLGGGGER